ncbi:unnamed protein product [Brassica rapa subsp. narinosa]
MIRLLVKLFLLITLINTLRKLIEEIDEYDGEDPLFPWIKCVKWVQEAFPPGGECSGLLVIYEQCVRKFWHSERSMNDLLLYWKSSLLKESEHALYYIDYGLHMEFTSKVKTANEIFNLGISRNAKPVEKLNDVYMKFMVRTMRRSKEPKENELPSRSFGTVLSRGDNNNTGRQALGPQAKRTKPNHPSRAPLAVYKNTTSGDQTETDKSKPEFAFKAPQKPIVRAAASSFEVFVDEKECTDERVQKKKKSETISSSSNVLPLNEGREIKK